MPNAKIYWRQVVDQNHRKGRCITFIIIIQGLELCTVTSPWGNQFWSTATWVCLSLSHSNTAILYFKIFYCNLSMSAFAALFVGELEYCRPNLWKLQLQITLEYDLSIRWYRQLLGLKRAFFFSESLNLRFVVLNPTQNMGKFLYAFVFSCFRTEVSHIATGWSLVKEALTVI